MKTFEIRLKHDHGEVSVYTRARTIDAAKQIVLEAENAPAAAILWWRVVPTRRQIQKTKNLLRCL